MTSYMYSKVKLFTNNIIWKYNTEKYFPNLVCCGDLKKLLGWSYLHEMEMQLNYSKHHILSNMYFKLLKGAKKVQISRIKWCS